MLDGGLSPHIGSAQHRLSSLDCLLYCIGAQKAGTTWLYGQLRQDGQVHFAHKEFHYWDAIYPPGIEMGNLPVKRLARFLQRRRSHIFSPLKRLGGRVKRRALAWEMLLTSPLDHDAYAEALVQDIGPRRVAGDITPAYALLGRTTFRDMAALHPNARFVFIMRDPVERLWSSVRHRSRHWVNDPKGGAEVALRSFRDALADPMDPAFRKSDYKRTWEELDAAVPGDQVLGLFYETLFNEETMKTLSDFIGITPPKANFGTRTLKGVSYGDDAPSAAELAEAREKLAPTYDYVAKRFGAAVPESWMKGDMTAATHPQQEADTA